MSMKRRCLWYGHGLAYAALLACSACGDEPIVVLGQVHTVAAAPDAGVVIVVDAAAHPGEDHECTEVDPVCGSDGMTYQNRCRALAAGVSVVKLGAC
jgi:hypothetical protein